jgi:hypothetical protein
MDCDRKYCMAISALTSPKPSGGKVRADPHPGALEEGIPRHKGKKGNIGNEEGLDKGGKDTPTMIAVIHLISVLKV